MSERSLLAAYFNLYEFTTGRRLVALRRTKEIAEQRGDDAIAAECDEAIGVNEETLTIDQLWRKSKQIDESVRGLVEPDRLLDRAVTGLHGRLTATTHSFGPDHPRSEKAQELVDEFYPDGAIGVTHLEYEDEVILVQRMVEELRTTWKSHVELLGLQPDVDLIASRVGKMHKAMLEEASREVDFGQVRAARHRGQEAMLSVAAKILGVYNKSSDEHVRARNVLLGPIMQQNELIGEMYRRHNPVSDVDPDTGEDLVDTPNVDQPVVDA